MRPSDEWPHVELVEVSPRQLHMGQMLTFANRWGVRKLRLRLIRTDRRGRPYVIGHDPRTHICHRAWLHDLIHAEPRKGTR